MAYRLKCGAIFLHIPKTGGTWVKRVLYDQGLLGDEINHEHADFFRSLYPLSYRAMAKWVIRNFPTKVFDQIRGPDRSRFKYPYSFCFVRHPLRWYESYWKFSAREGWRDWGDEHDIRHWHPNALLNGLGSDDFNRFARNVICKRPGYVTELYGMYAQPQVNFVGTQENLADDLISVLRELNLNFDEDRIRRAERINESGASDARPIVWDDGLEAEMMRLEYASFVRYGYDYVPPCASGASPDRSAIGPGMAGADTRTIRTHLTRLHRQDSADHQVSRVEGEPQRPAAGGDRRGAP